jgi:hypothetical protein
VESGNETGSEKPPVPLDVYRRRARLRHALVTVEEALALAEVQRGVDGGKPTIFGLEQLRDDLLIALWLTQLGLANR